MSSTYLVLPPNPPGVFWGDPVANFGSLPASGSTGEVRLTLDTFDIYYWNGSSWQVLINPSATGDVVGPSGATGDDIAVFNGATGKLIKDGGKKISDLQPSGNYVTSLTGDLTGTGPGATATTLAASGVTAASYGDATHSSSITFDAKGRATAASSVVITPDMAQAINTLGVTHGGTNSSAALSNNRVMISSGGKIIEESAITANRALASDVNGLPSASATTDTELGYSSGVTSSIQTQLNGKQGGSSELTGLAGLSTTGIVTRTGAGTYTTRSLAASTGITVTNASGVSANPTIAVSDTAVSIGSYGDATHSVSLTVNQQGQLTAAASTQIDHSGLANLTSGDPHTQYALLAGRSGGQTLKGGTATGDNLNIYSTSAASPTGAIFMQSSLGVNASLQFAYLSSTQLTSNTNDWLPANGTECPVLRFSSNSAINVTGLDASSSKSLVNSNRLLVLLNLGSFAVTLVNNSSSSLAANRFQFGGDVILNPNEHAIIWSLGTGAAEGWRLFSRGIPDKSITTGQYTMSTAKLLGRTTAGTGRPEELAVSSSFSLASGTLSANAELAGLGGLAANGVVTRTGAGTYSARTIASTTTGLAVTNGDGVSGAPSLALNTALQNFSQFNTNGVICQTAANTFAGRTITQGTGITVTNGDGVAGAPSIATNIGSAVQVGSSTDTTGTISIGAGATMLQIELLAAGGGGGAGRQGASASARFGGGGGGGGGYTKVFYKLSELSNPSTLYYSLGLFGGGAIGQASSSTSGANGVAANDSFVRITNVGGATIAYAQGGTAGLGGTAAQQAIVAGGIGGVSNGGAGGASSTTLGNIVIGGSTGLGGGGGGAGASINSSNTTITTNTSGSAIGINAAVQSNTPYGGSGGAGASAAGNNAGFGGNNYGGGGGGGSASLNGTTSGGGGAGAPAIVRVIWW